MKITAYNLGRKCMEEIEAPELEFFAPKEGDPSDYVRIKLASGERVTITNSCAANVLGLVKENDYSYGIVESARKCMQPLADYLGVSVEECARQILHKAFEKIEPVIDELVEKYRIEKDQSTLVGVGGGASALLPYSANQMNMNYSIPKYAEVISSIGVALAMIRDVVERVIPNPTTEDISKIKKEAAALAIKNGAVPETVEVQIEIDPQTSKVTAIAMGSNEVQTTNLLLNCDEEEARKLAAGSIRGAKLEEVKTLAQTDAFYVFGCEMNGKQQVRLVDHRGFIKVQVGDGIATICKAADWKATVEGMWKQQLAYKTDTVLTPDVFLCVGGKVLDFSNTVSLEQLEIIMESEFLDIEPEEEVLLVVSRTELN